MRIMTWNVDWFRNGQRNVEPKNRQNYHIEDCSRESYKRIVDIIKRYLKLEDSIVVLQEVPFKINKKTLHPFYTDLRLDFPKNEYKIFNNVKDDSDSTILRATIAISKKDRFTPVKNYYPCNNRTIGIQDKNNNIIIGVHMPTNFKLNDGDDNMWTQLIEYVKGMERVIIVGDFNAYVGCNDKLTEKRYKDLLNYAYNCVDESKPTYKLKDSTTSIDKILTRGKRREPSASIESTWEYSDHKYVCINIDWN